MACHFTEEAKFKGGKKPLVVIIIDVKSEAGRGVYQGIQRFLLDNQKPWDVVYRFEYESISGLSETKKILKQADGVILGTLYLPGIEIIPERLRKRTVITYPHYRKSFDCKVVCSEDIEIGRIAAKHFMQQGFEDFVFISDNLGLSQGSEASQMRLQGYREVVENYNCTLLFPHSDIKLRSRNELSSLLKELFDQKRKLAIFLNHDNLSMIFHKDPITRAMFLSRHVGVVGVNNDTFICESEDPPLSSINPDYFNIGYRAAETVNRLFDEREKVDDIQYIPPKELVERASSNALQVNDKHLIDAVNYIKKNACKGCQVNDVLDHLGTNSRNLLRKFQKHLKVTPQEMILEVKMKAAKKLLIGTDFTVQHIAESLGYGIEKSLRKTFIQNTGMTPGAFRKANRDYR